MASPMYPFRNYKAEGSKIAPAPPWQDAGRCTARSAAHCRHANRSEEHTSELQSLMRNSYAVFCLKKKNTKISEYIFHCTHSNSISHHSFPSSELLTNHSTTIDSH